MNNLKTFMKDLEKNGKQHGFFYTYSEETGELIKTELYEEDQLIYWAEAPDLTTLRKE